MMTSLQTHERQRPSWFSITLLGVVIVCLAAAFVLLERRRSAEQKSDFAKLYESLDGEVISAKFLVKDVTTDQLESLERYPQIESLIFSSTRSVEGGLRELRRFGRLKALDLSRTEWVTAAVLQDLAALPHLRRLILTDSSVSDECLSQVASCMSLETLFLDGCVRITDAAVEPLEQIATLQSLNLTNTAFTLDGFRRLRTSRPDLIIDCTMDQFAEFRVRNSELTSAASPAELEMLLQIPHDWTTGKSGGPLSLRDVRSLKLTGPSTVESMALLAPELSELHSLSIPAATLATLREDQVAHVVQATLTDVATDVDLRPLQVMPQLRHLELTPIAPLTGATLRELGRAQHVESISLESAGLSDELCEMMRQIQALRHVSLKVNSPLTSDDLRCLVNLPHLTLIRLEPVGAKTELLDSLSQVASLRALELELDSALEPDAIEALCGLSDLQFLTLSGPGVGDVLVAALAELPALEHLTIRNSPVGDAGVASFLERVAPTQLLFENTNISSPMSVRLTETWHRSWPDRGYNMR